MEEEEKGPEEGDGGDKDGHGWHQEGGDEAQFHFLLAERLFEHAHGKERAKNPLPQRSAAAHC